MREEKAQTNRHPPIVGRLGASGDSRLQENRNRRSIAIMSILGSSDDSLSLRLALSKDVKMNLGT